MRGSPSFVWEQKLKATKVALKDWIKNPIKTPTTQRKESTQILENLQMEFEKKDVTRTDLEEEQAAQAKTFLSFRQEEEFLRLKSRCLWLKESDQNTSYFHKQCRIRLSKNHIAEITTSDGTLLKGQDQIKLEVESHYQLLFKDNKEGNEDASTDFISHIPSLVNKDDNSALSKQFTEEEICNIIWAMEPDKAQGPDNFSILFTDSVGISLKGIS